MTRTLTVWFALSSATLATAQTPPADMPVFPRELEIELALNAAPPHLRDGAAVLVFEPSGYVAVREGRNGFTCVVSRRGGDLFPACWDREGLETLVRVEQEAAAMRLAGRSTADVQRVVDEGFKSGKYKTPSRGGVSFMLSPLRFRIDATGRATNSNAVPHVMFYAPNVTDADVGGVRGGPVFMNRVGPDGMLIVPVGTAERASIAKDSASLIERVERQLGVRVR